MLNNMKKIQKKLLFNIKYENLFIIFVFFYGIIIILLGKKYLNLNVLKLMIPIEIILILYSVSFCSRITQIKTILALSFIGIDYALMLTPLIFIPLTLVSYRKHSLLKSGKTQLLALFFVIYGGILYIVNIFTEFSPLSYIFWIFTFASGIILFIYYSQFKYNISQVEDIFKFFYKLLCIELILIALQMLILNKFKPGDWATGSFGNAHYVGFHLTIMLFFLFSLFFLCKSSSTIFFKFKRSLLILLILIFVLLTDSKIIYVCFFLGFILFLLIIISLKSIKLNIIPINQNKIYFLLIIFVIMLLFIPNFFSYYYKFTKNKSLDFNHILKTYKYEHKAIFYRRIFSHFPKTYGYLRWIIGTGPGTLGSRASNSLAYDTLYKKRKRLPSFIPPHTSKWSKKYLVDLWQKEYAEGIWEKSSILAMPFCGVCSIKGELGFIGLIIFLLLYISIIWNLIKKINFNYAINNNILSWLITFSICWTTIILLIIFDNFQ